VGAAPIDLIPEFLPVIGPLDDIVVLALAFRYAARSVPRETLLEAWPGDPGLLHRLIGPHPQAILPRTTCQRGRTGSGPTVSEEPAITVGPAATRK